MTKPDNPPRGAPMTDAEFRTELRQMMYDDLRQSADTTLRPAHRYNLMASAYENAQGYRQAYGTNGLPDALRDPEATRAQMRGLGNMAIHTFVHEINGNMVPVGTNGWLARDAQFREIERTIKDMAERGLQSEEESYRAFGGKEAFERRRDEARQNRDVQPAPKAQVATANDIGGGTTDPSVLVRQASVTPDVKNPSTATPIRAFSPVI